MFKFVVSFITAILICFMFWIIQTPLAWHTKTYGHTSIEETVVVSIYPNITVDQLIAVGNYDKINERVRLITRQPPQTEQSLKIRLIPKNDAKTARGATWQLAAMGLRPATVLELLSIGSTSQELQNRELIIALGDNLVSEISNELLYPCLWSHINFEYFSIFGKVIYKRHLDMCSSELMNIWIAAVAVDS